MLRGSSYKPAQFAFVQDIDNKLRVNIFMDARFFG